MYHISKVINLQRYCSGCLKGFHDCRIQVQKHLSLLGHLGIPLSNNGIDPVFELVTLYSIADIDYVLLGKLVN